MKRNHNILMAEDDLDDIFLVKKALEDAKIQSNFHVVHDGQELLEELNKQVLSGGNAFPDLILVDIDMPRISGIKALELIRKNPVLKKIPIIMLTTSSNQGDIDICYSLGANSYLIKPKSLGDLTDSLNILREYWFETVQMPSKNDSPFS